MRVTCSTIRNFHMTVIMMRFVSTLNGAVPVRDAWMHLKGCGRNMREKQVEQKLVRAVKARGGICPKFVSPGFDGMPDRVVLLPGRHFGFVEVKAPGKVPRPLQAARHAQLRKLGFEVFILDDPAQIPGILKSMEKQENEAK